MGDLETFINDENLAVPALIKIAIVHYQFETIHPFLDGNGRIGRLLITLFLVNQKILDKPLLYISTYFEKNKELYYDNLHNTRVKNDMLQWIKYFLVGIEQTATVAVDTLSNVISFKSQVEETIRLNYGRRSNTALILLNHLLKNPFVMIDVVSNICGVTYKAANDLVKKMCDDKFLSEVTGQSRNRIFAFGQYLNLFK